MHPLVFEPYLRPMVWGGRRLGELFGKALPSQGTFGESWELSAHPHHVSRVAEGAFRGRSLTELCAAHPQELFGDRPPPGGEFPLLVKLLDCRDLLSIQVHPTDESAPRLAGERLGKTEAWVVLDVSPGGRIFAGLKSGVGRADVVRHLEAGTLAECLNELTPRPGDCVFLPAGTVHAVGGGVVLAEVQQSSDATFRLFDWNRPGTDGKPRQLHIPQSLESINWDAGPVRPRTGQRLPGLSAGVEGERLVSCPYFELDRFRGAAAFRLPTGRLSLWMVLDGTAELCDAAGTYRRAFRRGETVLVPAACSGLSWQPENSLTALGVTLPL